MTKEREEKRAAVCLGYYQRLIEPLRTVARLHGYALAVHGSLRRDIDLIAVPWVAPASEPIDLAEAIRAEAERITGACWPAPHEWSDPFHRVGCPGMKPHRRLSFNFFLVGEASPYLDLAVMPRAENWPVEEMCAMTAAAPPDNYWVEVITPKQHGNS